MSLSRKSQAQGASGDDIREHLREADCGGTSGYSWNADPSWKNDDHGRFTLYGCDQWFLSCEQTSCLPVGVWYSGLLYGELHPLLGIESSQDQGAV